MHRRQRDADCICVVFYEVTGGLQALRLRDDGKEIKLVGQRGPAARDVDQHAVSAI